MDRILPLFRFAEVRAESEKKSAESQARRSQIWPRLLSFNPSSPECEDEEEEGVDTTSPPSPPQEIPCEEEEEQEQEEEECEEDVAKAPPPQCGNFSKKLGCMYNGARFGLKEGALSGVFFGGGFGMYKYFDATYLKGEKDGGENSDESNEESTLNDNIIFVTAANGAIAMAVFCTLFCSTKALIYCS